MKNSIKNIRRVRRFLVFLLAFNLFGVNSGKFCNIAVIVVNSIAIFCMALYEIKKSK